MDKTHPSKDAKSPTDCIATLKTKAIATNLATLATPIGTTVVVVDSSVTVLVLCCLEYKLWSLTPWAL